MSVGLTDVLGTSLQAKTRRKVDRETLVSVVRTVEAELHAKLLFVNLEIALVLTKHPLQKYCRDRKTGLDVARRLAICRHALGYQRQKLFHEYQFFGSAGTAQLRVTREKVLVTDIGIVPKDVYLQVTDENTSASRLEHLELQWRHVEILVVGRTLSLALLAELHFQMTGFVEILFAEFRVWVNTVENFKELATHHFKLGLFLASEISHFRRCDS